MAYQFVPPINLPPHMVNIVAASAERALTIAEWLMLFQNADFFGPPINPYHMSAGIVAYEQSPQLWP